MKSLAMALAVLGMMPAVAAAAEDPLPMSKYIAGLKVVKADQRISYGPAPSQFADLYLPKGAGPFPVVILVHGGCWGSDIPSTTLSSIAADLATHGVAVWNIEYRRIGEPGGGYPGMYQDVSTAVDRLRGAAADYKLDLSRIIAVGHSSGAHLALWAASRAKLPATSVMKTANPLPIRTVVVLNGLGDLEHNADLLPLACGTDGPTMEQIEGAKTAARPDPLLDTSPNKLLPTGVRTVTLMGEYDAIVPPYVGLWWRKVAERSGDTAVLRTLPDAGHFDVVTADQPEWATARDTILAEVAALKK